MDLLIMGIQTVFNPIVLLWIALGVTLGVIFGALPGVSATMAIVLCISFTYGMEPVVAISFLAAVYCAAITGGSITAILFKIPGTPSSAATVLDGYPMVERGEAGKALSISLICSGIGGLLSAVIMFLLTQPLMAFALKFNSAEQFAVCMLGIGILIFLDSKRPLNTFVSALIGMWISTVGMDRFSNVPRFTFGSSNLLNGIDALPFMLGMFAVVEILNNIFKPTDRSLYTSDKQADISKMVSFREMWDIKWTTLRSGLLGSVIGIIPGAGATIASWLSYSIESKLSKHPEMLGKGDPHGISASETANNAATGGAMVPLLAMGIPGSNAAAMMMTALSIHGVTMGPILLKSQPVYLSATFSSMILANILMIFISLIIAKMFSKVLAVPYYMLGTLIIALALTGCYSYQASMFDVWVMVLGGVFGFFFKKYGFNISALILGMVLGGDIEYYFRRALMLYGDVGSFFSRPLFTCIILILVAIYAFQFISIIRNRKKQKA